MEKENYETYEYLPASGSNSETEPYQFFVVQDDGTFLINRQVQYVTQVQANKDALEGQPCTMLDVAPQQFFVDVDTTAEMIPVPEQFNISEGSSNLYANNYLLQPGTGTPVVQLDNHAAEQLKANLQVESLPEANKQTNSLTEITITDDQYQMLEQKGWVLLETNGKNYVLDTFGLHDITTNDKLIQKLKTEETTSNLQPETRQTKIEQTTSLDSINVEILTHAQNESKLESPTETECASDLPPIVDECKEEEAHQKPQWDEKKINSATNVMHATLVDNSYNAVCEKWKDGNVLRIRTDFCLKDIPDKIVLGKTKNGKRLVCKVIKPAKDVVKQNRKTEAEPTTATVQNSIPPALTDVGDFEDDKLDNIFKVCFKENAAQYSPNDVKFAEKVVMQLLRLPAVKPSVVNRNLLITKMIVNEKESSIIKSLPTLVTGTVSCFDNEWRFLHKPDLYVTAKRVISQEQNEGGAEHNFLHMHIHETQRDDQVVRTAVALNKLLQKAAHHSEKIFIPDLPLNLIPQADTENTTYYACGVCAAIFQSEKELNKHRETHKMDMDNKLTTDKKQDNFAKNGILVLQDPSNKSKKYTCMQCNARFQRLNNCQRHVKIHMAPVESESSGDKKRFYECNICYSLFYHAPTLQRHIMKNHIKVNK